MKIMVDENMPYAEALFGRLGDVQAVNGREISAISLAPHTDALMVRSVTRVDKSLLDGSQVTFVGTATAGTDHVDEDWLTQAGIGFFAAPGCNAIAVVEYVLSALLWLAQRDSFVLRDKIIGIIGVGNIGSLLQKRLNAFGVHTMLCDPLLAELGTPGNWQPLEKLVSEADVLTFHTPLTYAGKHATWHLVDEALLTALPPGRIIINTCRGAVVDNNALLRTLELGKPICVVLDVWELEPTLSLSLLDRVDIGTAHIAGYTLEGKIRGTVQIFNAYSAFVGSGDRANLVELLPPTMTRIRLHSTINEKTLHMLARTVYDVQHDDMKLRRVAGLSGEFDRLRKNYYQRREWSSLCVEVDNEADTNILRQLGFKAFNRTLATVIGY